MRYLISKVLDARTTNWLDNQQYKSFLEQNVSSMEYTKELEAKGKIIYHGIVAGSSSSFWIVEADSAEEVDLMVKGLPVFPLLKINIQPLVSADHVLNEIKSFMATL